MKITKRWPAPLLAVMLLCFVVTGCAGRETAGSGEEDTSTALGVMRKYNTALPQEIDGNYRATMRSSSTFNANQKLDLFGNLGDL